MATALDKAKKNKADEFYTQMPDIEAEMRHYQAQFRGKVIFCNCDDPYESNFFKYFAMNFNFLGLKKLIATCYTESPVASQQLSLFDVKSLEVKNIFKNFNSSKDTMDGLLKEIRNQQVLLLNNIINTNIYKHIQITFRMTTTNIS